jgi:hypothetical protein
MLSRSLCPPWRASVDNGTPPSRKWSSFRSAGHETHIPIDHLGDRFIAKLRRTGTDDIGMVKRHKEAKESGCKPNHSRSNIF